MAGVISCKACGAHVNTAGVFPGARLACACGAENVVTVSAALSGRSSPYRTATPPPPLAPPAAPRTNDVGPGQCPRCGGALESGDARECTQCHGVFVSWDALTEALARRDGEAEGGNSVYSATIAPLADEPVTYLLCPACGESMSRTLYSPRSGLIVDVCSAHGLWFDAGEIERARHFPVMARRTRTRTAALVAQETDERIQRQKAEVEAIAFRERVQDVREVLDGRWTWDGRRRHLVDDLVDVLFDF